MDKDMTVTAPARIDRTALVEPTAAVGDGSTVWGQVHIRARARVGRECVIGRGVFIDVDVEMGDRCKVQNDALLYTPARLGTGVFVGPAAVLTNDPHPRAVNPDGSPKSAADWVPVGVEVGSGASIGARAVCVAPVIVGEWALIAAGAVVVHDVPAYALMAGVPARRVAWVGRAGHRLLDDGAGHFTCPVTSETYREDQGGLVRDR